MPSVSVVIPNHNHGRYLGQAIDGVLAQTLLTHEVIVVDDGSTDESTEVLAKYKDQVRVIRQRNQGVAAARNAGAAVATGDFLAFLDSDDVWLPRKLEQQVARFVAEPDMGMVHCGVEEINAAGDAVGRRLDGLEGWVAREFLLFRQTVVIGAGSTALFPRTLFEEIGGFDIRLSTSADWDLCYRIASRHKVGFVPSVLVKYRMHGANMHLNIRAMEHDMLLAYEKAFNSGDAQLDRLRRRSYGNLHSVLAGSFFSAGQYLKFVEHALKSLLLTPRNIGQFAGYPVRQWRRHRSAKLPLPSSDSREPLNSQ